MNENNKHATKWMQLPRNVCIGHGVIYDTGKVCKDLKLNGCAHIIAGKTTMEKAGRIVREVLEDEGYDAGCTKVDSASLEDAAKVENDIEPIIKSKTGFLIGVGGGKSIDIAKFVSAKINIPFISIPTAASHDGIVSSRASIKNNDKSESIDAQAPIAVIADSEIIASAPFRLLAAGCGDMISKHTAVLDWQLAHRLRNNPYSEYAAALSLMSAKIIMDSAGSIKPGLEESARIVLKALVSSGVAISIAGSSQPASGSEHKFSHALDRIAPKPALHGEQCGVGTIMMMYLHGGNWKEIRSALMTIGAPTSASELGIAEEHIIDALVSAHKIRPERYTILGTGLTREAAENVARITKVID